MHKCETDGEHITDQFLESPVEVTAPGVVDRKSTRLNSSH